ncbi:MAG: tetratricopeptide repeat protein [Bacteroidetes bacterium]|nr:tetratricopeptide repeat protein [Bacteroidota bacterium]
MFFILLWTGLGAAALQAQGQNELLARQYFSNGEFDKAAVLYEQLSNEDPSSLYLYDRYLQCLMEQNAWDQAGKWVKKRARKYPMLWHYKVDEGYLMEKQGQKEQAALLYARLHEEARRMPGNQEEKLAAAFSRRNLFSEAIRAYEQARLKSGDPRAFGAQLADLYTQSGNRAQAIEEDLTLLEFQELDLPELKGELSAWLEENDYPVLRDALIKRLQRNPDHPDLYALLQWTYVQLRDWNGALIQAKAMDRRQRQEGYIVYQLAQLMTENGQFSQAASALEYIFRNYPNSQFYDLAKTGWLENRARQLEQDTGTQTLGWEALAADCETELRRQGYQPYNAPVTLLLSRIYLVHLHRESRGIEVLEQAVESPAYRGTEKAAMKLELADAYLASGDVWESDLLYGQVDREFPEEAIGQEARFRRARLSYFRGEFEWAQTQLEVLKGATTQLISNNAIRLSLLIQDNIGLDSNETAMGLYAQAELKLMQHRTSEAELLLDSITRLFPVHSLRDDIVFTMAQIREEQGRYAEAAALYEKVATVYSYDILADNAWYQLGMLYKDKLHKPEQAKAAFEAIIVKFPGSLFVVEARKYYRALRGDAPAEP